MTDRRLGAASLIRQLGAWRHAGGGTPAYRQLSDALRLLILDGRLPLATRLPGERELAGATGLSRTTVTAAFASLRDAGFLEARPGSGVRTCLPGPAAARPPFEGVSGAGVDVINLAAASLPAGQAVHGAYATALEALPAYLPSHGYLGEGLQVLRTAIAQRYARRGLPTDPAQIMVTSGALHGLALMLRLLTRPGDRVLVDHPTFPHALDSIQRASCRPTPVALPERGWDVDGFAAALRRDEPRMAYLIADFHNPTGRCMTAPERAALAKAAAGSGAVLVVDETLTDLGLDMPPPAPDPAAEAAIVRLGSMGKSFWGGLRIGWIRADPDVIAALVAVRPSLDLGTPLLEQIAAASLLDAEAGLEARREMSRERRAQLVDLLRQQLPAWRFEAPTGGLSIWAELPAPISTLLAATSERFGLRLAAGPRFGVGGAFERFIRLPYTQPPEVLEAAVGRLVQTVEALDGARRTPRSGAADMRTVV